MAWINEDATEHEGYSVGLVDGGNGRLRELGYPEDRQDRRGIAVVSAACTCGWRSKRFEAPFGTEWVPFCLMLRREGAELQLIGLWSEHVADELKTRGRLRSDMLPYAGEFR